MEDKLQEVFDATTDALIKRLNADEMGAADIKAATDFLKMMKYDAIIIPGSKVEEVETSLTLAPKIKQG